MQAWQVVGRRRWALLLIFVAACLGRASAAQASTALQSSAPTPGISRALAADRAARVANVGYQLELTLEKHASAMTGLETLQFVLSPGGTASDLPLDYRQGTLQDVTVNGSPLDAALDAGHLVIPASLLRSGSNVVKLGFTSRVATSGAAITRYDDKEDGSEYLYSLFVPMDASMAFPCFDQPDLKGRFTLAVTAPADWTVIGNTAGQTQQAGQQAITRFPQTKPISTYLFAFAAGPWARIQGNAGDPTVYVRRSQESRARPELPELQSITRRGMAWLADYFQQPFPFPKYDMVLIPGFPFGGMEHAGATFLNEEGVLFRSAPTASDRFRRDITTLHELTHQWFGDLVTMRWFDDLWLKEGFAQYMAYRCLDSLEPDAHAWKHFYEDVKPLAYGIDETEGTTPVYQNIPNLLDAKSAYGAIVYQKAPAVLRQLEFRLGQDNFQAGLRLYLAEHAYANAQWSDLIDAFHRASGQDVGSWADAWILRRGMPEVDVEWRCGADETIAELRLRQHDVLPDGYVWPISNEVVLGSSGKAVRVDWNTPAVTVAQAIGRPCPAFVFANGNDEAYGRFLLDHKSEVHASKAVQPAASGSSGSSAAMEPLLRSMLWGALWENVRVASSAPVNYVKLVTVSLPAEQDESLARLEGAHATTALHRYMTAEARTRLVRQVEQIATDRMLHAPAQGMRIISFRTLTAVAETPEARLTVKHLLGGELSIPGVDLRPLDRWNLVGRLIALNDPDAQSIFVAEQQRDRTGDGLKYAWAVRAGTPNPAVKQSYFAQYVQAPGTPGAKQEDWLTQSLRPFNSWDQAQITEPYLQRALDQLPEIKRDRKIFFLGAWLGAFLDGQVSPEAESVVQRWLAQPGIAPDLRLKVLEYNDELQRTVRIRDRFPQ